MEGGNNKPRSSGITSSDGSEKGADIERASGENVSQRAASAASTSLGRRSAKQVESASHPEGPAHRCQQSVALSQDLPSYGRISPRNVGVFAISK